MYTINVKLRTQFGKGASRRLRHLNQLPAIVYGGNDAPVSVELEHDAVANIQSKPEFYEPMVLVIDGKETTVKIQALQRHPFKPKITHIDFVRV